MKKTSQFYSLIFCKLISLFKSYCLLFPVLLQDGGACRECRNEHHPAQLLRFDPQAGDSRLIHYMGIYQTWNICVVFCSWHFWTPSFFSSLTHVLFLDFPAGRSCSRILWTALDLDRLEPLTGPHDISIKKCFPTFCHIQYTLCLSGRQGPLLYPGALCSLGCPRAWGQFQFFSVLGGEQGCFVSSQSVVLCHYWFHGRKEFALRKVAFLSLFFCLCPLPYVSESNFFPQCATGVSMSLEAPSAHTSLKDILVNIVILHIYCYSPPPVTKDLKYYTAVRPDRC